VVAGEFGETVIAVDDRVIDDLRIGEQERVI
jgi:hypothetical protein